MEELTICTWRWGAKYGPQYVERLAAGLHRHLAAPFSFRVFSSDPADVALTEVPGCFARLRMFDPAWQIANGVRGRLVCLDLDLVVTGLLDGLFDRPEPFVILQGVNTSNPCPFNGSVMMLRSGYRPDVWSDFSLGAARQVPFDSFPDDQAWLAHKLPDAGAFTAEDGVYGFQKRDWPRGEALPRNARMVAFPGWRDPAGFQHLGWVQEHWRT